MSNGKLAAFSNLYGFGAVEPGLAVPGAGGVAAEISGASSAAGATAGVDDLAHQS